MDAHWKALRAARPGAIPPKRNRSYDSFGEENIPKMFPKSYAKPPWPPEMRNAQHPECRRSLNRNRPLVRKLWYY